MRFDIVAPTNVTTPPPWGYGSIATDSSSPSKMTASCLASVTVSRMRIGWSFARSAISSETCRFHASTYSSTVDRVCAPSADLTVNDWISPLCATIAPTSSLMKVDMRMPVQLTSEGEFAMHDALPVDEQRELELARSGNARADGAQRRDPRPIHAEVPERDVERIGQAARLLDLASRRNHLLQAEPWRVRPRPR